MRNLITAALILTLTISCSKRKSRDIEPAIPAVLILPAQNEACISGEVVSEEESKILFKWQGSEYTEQYELVIKNLKSGISTVHSVSESEIKITLNRNTPYAWYIISKSTKTNLTAKSTEWKFYNAGGGLTSNAPFPAEVISPAINQSINAADGKINLAWKGTDTDKDIVSYDIYFGTNNIPPLLASSLTADLLENIPVSPNTTYYWRIVTKDSKGNTSDSGLFQFNIN